MKKFFSVLALVIRWLWTLLTTGVSLVVNLCLLIVVLLVLSLFTRPEITVPDQAALVIAPSGTIVEKTTVIDPFSKMMNTFAGLPLPDETLLQDILDTIAAAGEDNRIRMVVLSLGDLEYAGLNQLRVIGQSLDKFKESGKKVIALDDYYSQGQYYLASYADEILLNPMGGVHLRGFGVFRLYLKELIDKLAVNFHVFRVGTYKSAVEPLTRRSMSEEARDANNVWLTDLWSVFCEDIARNRDFAPDFINTYINAMPLLLGQADGSNSRMALDANLVDNIKTGPEITDYLVSLVGESEDGKSFNQIHFLDYLATGIPSFTKPDKGKDKVGLIVARGNIVEGEEIPGQISSDNLCELIRQARDDDAVKAVVLRVDSGGGSAFASEQIRQELLLLQQKGKPLVVSMGTLAASGAYWISAGADKIFASPFTLTGSIGIFGIVPTFEKTIAKIGIVNDGIGTTSMAGGEDPTRQLPPQMEKTIQLSVEEGYNRFIDIVAEGRGIARPEVMKIAEGRVWDGAKAIQLGLVDEIGGQNEAIAAAAELAGLTDFSPVYIRQSETPGQRLLRKLKGRSLALANHFQLFTFTEIPALRALKDQWSFLADSRDPENIYAHCLIPRSALAF